MWECSKWYQWYSGNVKAKHLSLVGMPLNATQTPALPESVEAVSSLHSTGFVPFPLFSSVQSLSRVQLYNSRDCSTLGFPFHHQLRNLLKLMSIESLVPFNHLILCHPLLFLPSASFLSITLPFSASESFQWVSSSNQVAKILELQLRISFSNEYSGLISFRIDWFDLLAVQGTFKSLLQYHNSKASILWRSAFLMVQLSHPYMTTGKTIALTRWTFVGKWCLCFLIWCLGLS